MRILVALLVLGVLGAGCADDVQIRFPSAPAGPAHPPGTGTLVLLLGEPASNVAVAIDGWLVVQAAHTQRITIDGVPIGNRDVTFSGNGGDKQFRVWVDDTHPTTVPIGVPDQSLGFLKSVAGSVISLVVYALLLK